MRLHQARDTDNNPIPNRWKVIDDRGDFLAFAQFDADGWRTSRDGVPYASLDELLKAVQR